MIFHQVTISYKVSRTHQRLKNDLSVNVHRFTFFLYNEMEAWVLHMPKSIDQIKVWLDIVGQLSLFFDGVLSFSTHIAKAIRSDPSFRKCY